MLKSKDDHNTITFCIFILNPLIFLYNYIYLLCGYTHMRRSKDKLYNNFFLPQSGSSDLKVKLKSSDIHSKRSYPPSLLPSSEEEVSNHPSLCMIIGGSFCDKVSLHVNSELIAVVSYISSCPMGNS